MPLEIQDPKRLPKDFIVFYCWQDHLDKKLHRYLIRDALNAAIQRVQDELPDVVDCTLRQDSDTTGRAGSVEIANTILEKINASTMIVGDVTPVLFDESKKRAYPNPNVMLELGYGSRAIGWNRVICLYNNAKADSRIKAEELPFDIRHRRATAYTCADTSSKAKAAKELEAILVAAIRAVIQEIGRGVFDSTLGNAALKRARDIELLRQLLGTIHRTTMDRIIERGTMHSVHYDGLLFWEGFTAVMNSAHFRFYDKNLETLAWKLHEVWGTAVNLGGYVLYPGDFSATYSLLPEHQWTNAYKKQVSAMGKAYASMPGALKAFLDYVHEQYPEIDFKATDKAAWKDNFPYMTTNLAAPKETKPSEVTSAKPSAVAKNRMRKPMSTNKKKSVTTAVKKESTVAPKKTKNK